MPRIKFTKKIIDSMSLTTGRQPDVIGDTEVRSLHVYAGRTTKMYYLKMQFNGERHTVKIGNTNDIRLSDARDIARKLETEIRSQQYLPQSNMLIKKSCIDFLVPYYTNFVKDKNPLGIIYNFIIPQFGHLKINKLTAMEVQKVIHKLMQQRYAAESIRKRILVGKTLYKQLIKHQLVSFNPFNDLDLPTVSNIRKVVLTHEQRLPFIQCCLDEDSVYADLLLLLLVTGLRVSEGINIKLKDVSDSYTTLTLPKTKAGVVQHIALNSLAQEVLRRRAGLTWNQYLFPSSVHPNKPIASPRGCFLRIKERMKAMGHDIDNLHIHDLRRSFASACAEVTNGDMHMVASQLRHCSTNILRRYVHYQPANIAIASEATAKALISPIKALQKMEAK